MLSIALEIIAHVLAASTLDFPLCIIFVFAQAPQCVIVEVSCAQIHEDTTAWAVDLRDFHQLVDFCDVRVVGALILKHLFAALGNARSRFNLAVVSLEIFPSVDFLVAIKALEGSISVIATQLLRHWTRLDFRFDFDGLDVEKFILVVSELSVDGHLEDINLWFWRILVVFIDEILKIIHLNV